MGDVRFLRPPKSASALEISMYNIMHFEMVTINDLRTYLFSYWFVKVVQEPLLSHTIPCCNGRTLFLHSTQTLAIIKNKKALYLSLYLVLITTRLKYELTWGRVDLIVSLYTTAQIIKKIKL